MTKRVRGIHRKKGEYFTLLSVASAAISRKIYGITLSLFPIPLPSFVQIRPVFGDISKNVFRAHYNISVKLYASRQQ